jgi:hypothetical protein
MTGSDLKGNNAGNETASVFLLTAGGCLPTFPSMKLSRHWHFRAPFVFFGVLALPAIWEDGPLAGQGIPIVSQPNAAPLNRASSPAIAETTAARQLLATAPQEGILLLRNGQILEGKITRSGDLYYVSLPEGEIRMKATDVEFACHDLEEGYQRKRALMQVGDVHEHLRLAQWCQRHGLLDHAAAELTDARRANPKHPMIEVVGRRLQMALEPVQPEAKTAVAASPSVSFEQLDRMVRGLPPHTVETFSQTIQPLLLNNCTTGGCHGSDSPMKFHLLRGPFGQPASRRLTQRNLNEVLQFVDKEHPELSKLLTAPAQAHGTAKVGIFSGHQTALYRRLVLWTYEVANQPPLQATPSIADVEKSAESVVETSGFEFPATSSPRSSHANQTGNQSTHLQDIPRTAAAQPAVTQQEAVGSAPQAEKRSVKRGAAIQSFVPADPFDAEIFNRQFHGDPPPEAAAESVKR